ncbi:hypothetical protein PSACC_00097 [Paramicrosporidium saccamoebae]|uniref:FYVE-type domain-containing protein n=1 Tax=Paramicrosporidium saccamoebae TaxID=1246581 RepID=A0A2H9TQV0_9FUNG|nr:hypothetical protein PSACC_00097 [Paramicrosporidium saccamoebae]
MSSDEECRGRTKTGDSSDACTFTDALSETHSCLDEAASNISLSSLLPTTAQDARRRQADTHTLLNPEEPKLTTKIAGWMKNAATYFDVKPTTVLRKSSSGNIVQRVQSSPQPRIVDATDSICSFPNCVQPLNIAVSRFHCRRCNGWYCAMHTGHPSLGMKLVVGTGEPSPTGVWSRVCLRCFEEKYRFEGAVVVRGRMDLLLERRKEALKSLVEEARVLKDRLTKLGEYKASRRIPFRVYEQQIVTWQEDSSVNNCQYCHLRFSTVNRKHHCRLCGRIMCAESTCSVFFPLNLTDGKVIDLRLCTQCENTALRRPLIRKELTKISPLQPLHRELRQVKDQIDDILPRFNDQLYRFEYEMERPVPSEQLVLDARHESMTARDTLMLLFRHYEGISKKIKMLHVKNDTQESLLGENIHRAAMIYLQSNMFSLQMLPRLDMKRLQRPAPISIPSVAPSERSSAASSFLPRIFRGTVEEDGPIPLPANISALEQKLEVLFEQKEQLEGFLAAAVNAQRFDEVRTLRLSLEDVCREIATIQRIFRRLE